MNGPGSQSLAVKGGNEAFGCGVPLLHIAILDADLVGEIENPFIFLRSHLA